MLKRKCRLVVTGLFLIIITSPSLAQKSIGIFDKNTDVEAILHKALCNIILQHSNMLFQVQVQIFGAHMMSFNTAGKN